MDLSCKKCTQKYHIPDDQISSRRIYFNCEKCGYKIILDLRGENWLTYKGIDSEKLSVKDIFEGIYYSFNLKNIAVTFFILLSYVFLLIILSLVVSRNSEYIALHPVFSGFFLFLLSIVMVYVFDIHLYLVSKNIFNRIKYNKNLQFSSISPEIFDDLRPVFVLSAGVFLVLFLIFFPVFLMKDYYAFIYEGIFHSINLVLASFIVFIFFTKNILYSFIALRNRNFRDTFSSIFRFITIENINIPFYIFFISSITGFFFLLLSGLMFFGVFIIFSLMIPLLPGKGTFPLGGFFSFFHEGGVQKLLSDSSRLFGSVTDGLSLVLISTALAAVFVMAYLINLNQTISAVAVYIMESNPGRTVNRSILLITSGLIFAAGIYFVLIRFL